MMVENIHKIQFGSAAIEYRLEFQDRKNLTIKVYPDCIVKIITPYNTEIEKITQHIKKKLHG